MLQFHGKNIKADFDLWKAKIQTDDFVRSLKFDGINSEKLVALVHRLTKGLILNQTQAYITLDSHRKECRKGISIYVQVPYVLEKELRNILKDDYNFEKNSGFLDVVNVCTKPEIKVEVYIVKWLKQQA